MFGKIDGFAGCGIAGFHGESRGDSCDSGAINSGGVIGLLPFTPSQIISAVTIGYEPNKSRVD